MELTQKRLKEVLSYDAVSGDFVWTSSPCRTVKNGDKAGTINSGGYAVIFVDKKGYKAHRLAFLYMRGRFPVDMVDHINGNRLDNSWNNLRECSHSENQQNRKKRVGSTGIAIGVSSHSNKCGWIASITINKKRFKKYFKDEMAAFEWRKELKAKLHVFSPVDR